MSPLTEFEREIETETPIKSPINAGFTTNDSMSVFPRGGGRSRFLVAILVTIGLVSGIILPLIILILKWNTIGLTGLLLLLGLFIATLGVLGLFILIYWLSQRLERISQRVTDIDQQTAILAEQSVARTQADTFARRTDGQQEGVKTLLEQIHEDLLLPEAERGRRFQAMVDREVAERVATIEHLIDSHDFHRARDELAMLAERFGERAPLQETATRLEATAEAARAADVSEVKQRIRALIDEERWQDAERLARELGSKYPVSDEAATIIEWVLRERKAFELQHRQRMHEEIQQLVNQRRWQEALKSTRSFISTFPAGLDTDALREQLETLEANAEIQARQTLERYIKHYIQRKQYWDALGLARRIITEYPLSPQANALRGQLPRLEELARTQGPQQ